LRKDDDVIASALRHNPHALTDILRYVCRV